MSLDEKYLGQELSITNAYNSLLENKKKLLRPAYHKSGIYQFWEDEFELCNENNQIVICRENVYKTRWAKKDGGINFYNSLIKNYQHKERVFALYRYRKKVRARVLMYHNTPLLADIEIDFLDSSGEKSVDNIKNLKLIFSLNNECDLSGINEHPSEADLINESRRLKAVEFKEGKIVKYWHGIFQNRITKALRKSGITCKTEFQIAGRSIDIVSYPDSINRKVINIYEIKTASDREECERQSIVQLIDYYQLATDEGYEVRKLITVGLSKAKEGWKGKDHLDKTISDKWSYQSVPLPLSSKEEIHVSFW